MAFVEVRSSMFRCGGLHVARSLQTNLQSMSGVVFPPDGKLPEDRGTTKTGKAVLLAALDAAAGLGDAEAAKAAASLRTEPDKAWRFGYQRHVRAAVAAMARGEDHAAATRRATAVARAGLQAAHAQFSFARDNAEVPLREAMAPGGSAKLKRFAFDTGVARWTAADGGGPPAVPRGFAVPFEGKTYEGSALEGLLRRFAHRDEAEPTFADACAEIVQHQAEWGDLTGQVFVLIGATSEMGPCATLLQHGATVVALARRAGRGGAAKWIELLETAAKSPGTLLFPIHPEARAAAEADAVAGGLRAAHSHASRHPRDLATLAGADALLHAPEIVDWLVELLTTHADVKGKRPHVYSGIYLDGGKFVRASVAMDAIVDALEERLRVHNGSGGAGAKVTRAVEAQTPALLYIDTPSHVHVVRKAVTYAGHVARRQSCGFGLALAGACGLVAPPPTVEVPRAAAGETMVVMDFLSATQGPNYAIAKLIQRFRAVWARHGAAALFPDAASGADVARAKQLVSITSGPAAKTESVMHSKTMAMMMKNVHRVPPNVAHEPATVQVVMTMLMLRDLRSPDALGNPANEGRSAAMSPSCDPFDFLVENAWHGGMWRSPYAMEAVGKYIFVTVQLEKAAPFLLAAGVAATALWQRRNLLALAGFGEL